MTTVRRVKGKVKKRGEREREGERIFLQKKKEDKGKKFYGR